jgi:hypothetical protein
MATARLSMRKTKEILRRVLALGHSGRGLARTPEWARGPRGMCIIMPTVAAPSPHQGAPHATQGTR